MTKTTLWRLIAALFALSLLAAACGDSDDSSGGDSAETTEAAEGGGDDATETTVALTQGGSLLDTIQERGKLVCGVNASNFGFGTQNPDGSFAGFDVEMCEAVAAAILGDKTLVEFVALSAPERFTSLASGDIDVLIRNTTWTQTRDTELGADFGPTTYYDGQQVMAKAAAGFSTDSTMADLDGTIVCSGSGTTTELNISEAVASAGASITLQTFEEADTIMENFMAGQCDAFTADGSALAGRKALQQPEGEEHVGSGDVAEFKDGVVSHEGEAGQPAEGRAAKGVEPAAETNEAEPAEPHGENAGEFVSDFAAEAEEGDGGGGDPVVERRLGRG